MLSDASSYVQCPCRILLQTVAHALQQLVDQSEGDVVLGPLTQMKLMCVVWAF